LCSDVFNYSSVLNSDNVIKDIPYLQFFENVGVDKEKLQLKPGVITELFMKIVDTKRSEWHAWLREPMEAARITLRKWIDYHRFPLSRM